MQKIGGYYFLHLSREKLAYHLNEEGKLSALLRIPTDDEINVQI